jgi:predicted ATPase
LQHANNVISHLDSIEDKVNYLLFGIEAQMADFHSDGASKAAMHALGILGVKLPRKISFLELLWSVGNIKLLLRNKSNEYILNLPKMKGKKMTLATRILVLLCTYCLRNNQICYAVYASLQAIRLTMRYGLSPYSANAIAVYGVAEIALRNYAVGYRFGRLAMQLNAQMKSKEAECATMAFTFTFLTFWKDSLHDLQDALFRSGERGYEVGDIMYGEKAFVFTFFFLKFSLT